MLAALVQADSHPSAIWRADCHPVSRAMLCMRRTSQCRCSSYWYYEVASQKRGSFATTGSRKRGAGKAKRGGTGWNGWIVTIATNLDTSNEQWEGAFDEGRADQCANYWFGLDILLQPGCYPADLGGIAHGFLGAHARGHHGYGRHLGMGPVQHDQTHVVIHPDAGDAVRPVLRRGAEGCVDCGREVLRQRLEVRAEVLADGVESRADALPLPFGFQGQDLEVGVVQGVGLGRVSLPRRTKAHGHGYPRRRRHHTGETPGRSAVAAKGAFEHECAALAGQVARGEVGEAPQKKHEVVVGAVSGADESAGGGRSGIASPAWSTGSLTRHPDGPLALSAGIGSRGCNPYCKG